MFISGVKDTIKRHGLLDKGDTVVVSVSGGPDSTALLFALDGLKSGYGLKLHVAHLDHMFRAPEETLADREYVSKLARRLKLPLIYKRIDVPAFAKESGLSLEEAAREKRYEFLLKAARDAGAKKIALGHTLDDQAETVLMRLIRGSGLGGLRGIPPKRRLDGTFIIRPLIESWRKDVESYLAGMKITARRDATNLMQKFLRNRIRHELMVLLEKYNPNIKEALARSAQNFSYDYEVLSDAVGKSFGKCARSKGGSVFIDIKQLKSKPAGLRRGILRKAIESVRGSLRDIDHSHIEDIEGLMASAKGAIDLPGKARAAKSGNTLIFSMAGREQTAPRVFRELPVPGSAAVPELKLKFEAKHVKSRGASAGKSKAAEYLDLDSIKGPLHVRTWERGDRFRPLGMSKGKKLQDFFTDRKVPRAERASVPLLVCGKDIIWVCGMRLSDEVKVLPGTKRILKVSYRKA